MEWNRPIYLEKVRLFIRRQLGPAAENEFMESMYGGTYRWDIIATALDALDAELTADTSGPFKKRRT